MEVIGFDIAGLDRGIAGEFPTPGFQEFIGVLLFGSIGEITVLVDLYNFFVGDLFSVLLGQDPGAFEFLGCAGQGEDQAEQEKCFFHCWWIFRCLNLNKKIKPSGVKT